MLFNAIKHDDSWACFVENAIRNARGLDWKGDRKYRPPIELRVNEDQAANLFHDFVDDGES